MASSSNPASPLAVVQHRYGGPEQLQLRHEAPSPSGPGVLVRMRAAAVTQADWHLMRGLPYLIRWVGFGLWRPKARIPGQYLAGEVVEGGGTDFAVGDRVVGYGVGTYATQVRVPADQLVALPVEIGFEEAAALPHGGLPAWKAVHEIGKVDARTKVLVVGALGAVGSIAAQLAHVQGAAVTSLVRSEQAQAAAVQGLPGVCTSWRGKEGSFDLIIDTVRCQPNRVMRRMLKPGGRCLLISGGSGRFLGGMGGVAWAWLSSLCRRRKLVPFLSLPHREDLRKLIHEFVARRLRTEIGRSLPLDEISEAFRLLESKEVQGRIVVTT